MTHSRQPRSRREPYGDQSAYGYQEPGRGHRAGRSGILGVIAIAAGYGHQGPAGARHAERRRGKHRSRAA